MFLKMLLHLELTKRKKNIEKFNFRILGQKTKNHREKLALITWRQLLQFPLEIIK